MANDFLTPTEIERVTAEAYGADAWRSGVAIDGARAYSERPHIQRAWRDGWIKADDAQRQRVRRVGGGFWGH